MSYDEKAAAIERARRKRSKELGYDGCGHSMPCYCERNWLQEHAERLEATVARLRTLASICEQHPDVKLTQGEVATYIRSALSEERE